MAKFSKCTFAQTKLEFLVYFYFSVQNNFILYLDLHKIGEAEVGRNSPKWALSVLPMCSCCPMKKCHFGWSRKRITQVEKTTQSQHRLGPVGNISLMRKIKRSRRDRTKTHTHTERERERESGVTTQLLKAGQSFPYIRNLIMT